jgi:glutathione S-transferase
MGDVTMKLYMHPVSTATRPVRLFIAENSIECDEEMVDILKGAHYQEPYASLNPNRMVPMLEDGDLRLTESSAILKYLADKYDLPSYPKDLKTRAKVNEVMDWLNTQFYRDFGYGLIYPQLFPHHKRRSDEAHAGAIAWGQQGAKNWLQILNDHWIGPKNQYLCGNELSIRCAAAPANSAVWRHHRHAGLIWIASPLCTDIVCGRHIRLSRFPRGLFGVAHRAVAPRRRPGGGSAAV